MSDPKKSGQKQKVFGNVSCERCGALYPHERKEEPYKVRFECTNCQQVYHRSEFVVGVIKALKQ
jgi:hypothetical protein